MSLRSQIHDAIDDVGAPAPTLERRVKAFVLADAVTRKDLRSRPRPRWAVRFRGPLALTAAALVVILIAGLVLGGRFLRDRSVSPAPAIDHSVLRKLEARPLVAMPAMPATGECPVGPLGTDYIGGPAIGDGRVRTVVGGTPTVYTSDWGTWNFLAFAVDPTARGLIIIRARDLETGGTVFFAGDLANLNGVKDANIGRAILAGDVAGHDTVNGLDVPLRPELVINASGPNDFEGAKKAPMWSAYVGYAKSGTGCTFFQVDYLSSTQSETFTRKM